jgi:glc operon protein GlcG
MRSRPTLTATDVQRMMAVCKKKAAEDGLHVAIAIVDDGGFVLSVERLDGAARVAGDVALGKARFASLMRRPSAAMQKVVDEHPSIGSIPQMLHILPVMGGLPIIHEQECVGAIGVSGALADQDEDIARAGISAL